MFCKNCGKELVEQTVICPCCGYSEKITLNQIEFYEKSSEPKYYNDKLQNSQKNKWIKFILCLFLGYFGAHKFYEGKTGMGILYLLTCGLFGIGWFVDLILILIEK